MSDQFTDSPGRTVLSTAAARVVLAAAGGGMFLLLPHEGERRGSSPPTLAAVPPEPPTPPADGVVIYPVDGQKGVPVAFPGHELPDPIPDAHGAIAGYPVTASFPS